jgi:hypothetical protein
MRRKAIALSRRSASRAGQAGAGLIKSRIVEFGDARQVMMRRFLGAGACVLLLAGSAAAKPGVAMTTVNLRADANTNSEVLVKIPGSGRLDVGECKDGWCAATYQGKNGFVIATAVDTSGRMPRSVRRSMPVGPGYDPDDDDFVPAPGYRGYGPPVAYGPGPYYGPGYYGPPVIGFGYYGRGWRRW